VRPARRAADATDIFFTAVRVNARQAHDDLGGAMAEASQQPKEWSRQFNALQGAVETES
jgi:hypothetical protein